MKKQLRTIDQNALASVNGGMGIRKAISLFEAINASGLGRSAKRFLRQEVRSRIDD